MLALSSLVACGGDDVAGPDDPPNPAFIGPEGGTITGSVGTRITIPAGALGQEVAITVASFADPGTGMLIHAPPDQAWRRGLLAIEHRRAALPAAGSGSQDFGADMPLVFDWNVTINQVR